MTLRFASLPVIAFATLALAACGDATIANGNGGGGSGGSTTTTSSTNTTSSTTSSSTTGGEPCAAAGGACLAVTPDNCTDGIWGDPGTCGDGVGVSCCLPATNACAAAGGVCVAVTPDACQNGVWDSAMSCGTGVGVGCCLPKSGCGETCGTVGATRCIGNIVETCDYDPLTDCLPVWLDATSCPIDQECNATATGCIPSGASTCTTSAQCGCGCFCDTGECVCAGTSFFGSSCDVEDDCGPPCVGASCLGGTCVKPCTPGADQTCNDNPAQSSLAGHCNADQTCTCNSGYTKQDNGLCK